MEIILSFEGGSTVLCLIAFGNKTRILTLFNFAAFFGRGSEKSIIQIAPENYLSPRPTVGTENRKAIFCDICDKTLHGTGEWAAHLKSKCHKQSKKRKRKSEISLENVKANERANGRNS